MPNVKPSHYCIIVILLFQLIRAIFIMEHYPNDVVFDLFVIYGENNRIVDRTCRAFNFKYPHLPQMTKGKFLRLKNNFFNHGKVVKPLVRTKPITGNEDIEINALGYFQAYPRASIRTASADLGISYASLQRILCRHKLHPYKFIRLQKLHPGDYVRRINFCEEFLIRIHDRNFLQKIIWTDEAKFCQRGVFNRKNRHFWAHENPRIVMEVENQIQFHINVFCLLMDSEVRYFMYDENLNGEGYLRILREVVENYLDDMPLNRLINRWYQMDGAPAHSTRAVDTKLTELFEDRWWGNRGPSLWPARSPDLTPLDFYLWGRIKELVYTNPILDYEDLRIRIVGAFDRLEPFEIRRATQSVEERIVDCLNENGAHIEHLY